MRAEIKRMRAILAQFVELAKPYDLPCSLVDDARTLLNEQITPTDMVLVPRVPTKEMIDNAWAAATAESAPDVWKDMIEAWEQSR
jgi:hypothetical protein